MGKFTEEQINNILNRKGANGKQIDIFNLHGVLFIGNPGPVNVIKNDRLVHTVGWDLTQTYRRYSEHSLGIGIGDFEDCQTEEEVNDTFVELLEKAVKDNLV